MRNIYSPNSKYDARFSKTRCAASVPQGGRMVGFHQCQRKGKYSDADGTLWCKQHHPDTLDAKERAWQEKHRTEQKKRTDVWARESAIAKFCKGYSTKFLEETTLREILECDA